MERQWELAPANARIERRFGLGRDEFFERYYAAGRPVILGGEMADWPALARWTPSVLRAMVGAQIIEYQGERTKSDRFEMYKDAHRREMPFDRFIEAITQADGNDTYVTAYNSVRNASVLAALQPDLGFLDKFLSRDVAQPHGMMWIGPAGTATSLHHDLTNNFIAQLVGRKRLKVVPAADVGKLYNYRHVFSEVTDLEDPALDRAQFPLLAGARIYDVTLSPGEIIFMPLAWWHQVTSLDFSVTITYTNFIYPNDAYKSYPSE
jgi:ribosomal protein L16 Arg81 hydroxylase